MVSGSRDWDDEKHIYEELDKILDEYEEQYDKFKLVQGGAAGADAITQYYAYKRGWKVQTYPYLKKYGKRGGDARNKQMVWTERPHIALVFCKNHCAGSMNCWGHIVRYADDESSRLIDGRLIEPR